GLPLLLAPRRVVHALLARDPRLLGRGSPLRPLPPPRGEDLAPPPPDRLRRRRRARAHRERGRRVGLSWEPAGARGQRRLEAAADRHPRRAPRLGLPVPR